MLTEILKEFKEADGPLDMKALSQRLGVEQSALEGMVETLVRQGKLKEVGPEDCAHCDKSASCAHSLKGGAMGKGYELEP